MENPSSPVPWWKKWFGLGALPSYPLIAVGMPPLWKRIWQWVGVGGDIDFLASMAVRWPGMSNFFIDNGGIIVMVVAVVWLGIYARHSTSLPSLNSQRVLFLVAAALIVFVAFQLGRALPNLGSLLAVMRPIESWGITDGKNGALPSIELEMNLGPLRRYAGQFKVGALCRVNNQSIDFFSDPNILKSELFMIADEVTVRIETTSWFTNLLCHFPEYQCAPFLIENDGGIKVFAQRVADGVSVACRPAITQ